MRLTIFKSAEKVRAVVHAQGTVQDLEADTFEALMEILTIQEAVGNLD